MNSRLRPSLGLALFAVSLGTAAVLGTAFETVPSHLDAAPAPATADGQRPLPAPLFEALGDFSHRVSTRAPLSQRYFDQGMMFLFGFNHAEAIRSFRAAAELDPECAMAYWGVAFAYGPNINAPMDGAAVTPAWEALENARALRDRATPREQAYIDALEARYSVNPHADRGALDRAYAEAMRVVAQQFPDDLTAAVLFADAVMNTMAWDYWLPDRTTPKPATREVIRLLDDVLARDPRHPGANHAYIHLVEAGPEPWKGLPSADRLAYYAPDAGHLVHMPSHIYIRTGRYRDATLANERAAAGDRAYIAQCQIQGFYPGVYYPHNQHFIWYALSFEGRAAQCIAAAEQVANYALSPLCNTAVLEAPRLGHLPLLARTRFGRWEEILAAPAVPADRPMDQAMWRYARALAYSARGDAAGAASEARELDTILGSTAFQALNNPYLPASGIGAVARHLAQAKVAGARGDQAALIAGLRAAVEAERALPYMEPSFWYYPTRQTLAAALLQHGQPADAEAEFRADLREFPRNGWSLFGLAAALRAQNRADEAALVDREYAAAWSDADTSPQLSWF